MNTVDNFSKVKWPNAKSVKPVLSVEPQAIPYATTETIPESDIPPQSDFDIEHINEEIHDVSSVLCESASLSANTDEIVVKPQFAVKR